MTYKQIEASREARLWIGQIIVPTASAVIAMLTIPEVRQAVSAKAESIRWSINRKMNK